ncbi:MAG TPA: class I SAM-dependent methyltransferase [Candidatus Dormibacteraeota bacterium]
MAEERERRLVFGEVAKLYERYRPGYPDQAFDEVMEFGTLSPGDLALEVGGGTGRATLPLAARGLRVTALEPSPAMADVLRQKTKSLPGVEVEVASFEDWPLPVVGFDLLVSAQAWHWVRPEVAFVKASQALRPGGCLALLWNSPSEGDAEGDPIRTAIDQVYRREAPGLVAQPPGDVSDDRRPEIEASGLFLRIRREEYRWSLDYSAAEYMGLLETQSDHRLLSPDSRQRLLDGIAVVIVGQGGRLRVDYRTQLYLAMRP